MKALTSPVGVADQFREVGEKLNNLLQKLPKAHDLLKKIKSSKDMVSLMEQADVVIWGDGVGNNGFQLVGNFCIIAPVTCLILEPPVTCLTCRTLWGCILVESKKSVDTVALVEKEGEAQKSMEALDNLLMSGQDDATKDVFSAENESEPQQLRAALKSAEGFESSGEIRGGQFHQGPGASATDSLIGQVVV